MRLVVGLILTCALFLAHPSTTIFAKSINCEDRYVTLVNPVRGRNLWTDRTTDPIIQQYSKINQYNLPATWLLQYDAINDQELIDTFNKFNNNQEKGLFLEVSKSLADKARVIYPYEVDYFNPKAVFLSAYSQSDRRRIIDWLFNDFKDSFGYFPKSVGAWWIDSYSLNYMLNKYKISTALIVADQKTTDKYGVWGQWWGVPYYPSYANSLTPASSLNNKLNVAIIQWAQRDPTLAFGEGPNYSRYSLQANDYISQGKNTSYFMNLVKTYLDCQNTVGQVTIGLETGMESVDFQTEYSNQIRELQKISGLKFVTMSQFADKFKNIYPNFPKSAVVADNGSTWSMNTSERVNNKLNDFTHYNANIAFKDYFIADSSHFLDRKLPQLENLANKKYIPWWVLLVLAVGFVSYRLKILKTWTIAMLFAFAAFGLVFKSNYQYGWIVYYGGRIPSLAVIQTLLIIYSFLLTVVLSKWKYFSKHRSFLWLIPLSFGIDPVIQAARYSLISGKHYIGFATDQLGFIGASFAKPREINLLHQDFPAYQAAALLRLHFSRIWDNLWVYFFAYPILHIILAVVLSWVIFKLPKKIRVLTVVLLIVLFSWHILNLIQADPRYAVGMSKS